MSPSPRTPHRRARALGAVALALGTFAALVPAVVTAPPAGAARLLTADITGRGWGHGRGMSQYGAYGYASGYGWDSERILSHYYGGTRAADVDTAGGVTIDPDLVRIRLMGLDNQAGTLVATGAGSTLSLEGGPTLTADGQQRLAEAKAVRMLRSGDHWNVDVAASCNGPWEVLGATAGGTVTVHRASGTDELYTCNPDGSRRWYAGSIRATITTNGTRTLNITSIEEYLRGVVPNEMPADWHSEALEVQAVAARSYAMAGDTRHDEDGNGPAPRYADTCDTTTCQVYKGRYVQEPGKSRVASTHSRTDAAIAATAGEVRVFTASGRIARTEFSSTSGGWTAGGDFPAVEDLGDAISPVHTWDREDVSLAPLASLGDGTLTGVQVTERNGLGALGGRVVEVELVFDGEPAPVVVSGNTVRSKLGLRSDWFAFTGFTEDRGPVPPSGFYDVPESSVYAPGVKWAVSEGVTEGCRPQEFCPGADVTRAQAATFLWRHAGEPAGSGAQFDDVEDGTYYFEAVRWVRDRGITLGCTETRFCPSGTATRAQLVTFLWRHAGQPATDGDHGFSDVPDGAYYEDAVTWAVDNGITTGTTATRFDPGANVTRGQTVLFLQRYLA